MFPEALKAKFARMGARLELGELTGADRGRRDRLLALDIRSDAAGELFDIRVRPGASVELDVVDLRRRERHLLLQAREGASRHFYLCGHDERLQVWHKVLMNTEGQSLAMRHVVFLD